MDIIPAIRIGSYLTDFRDPINIISTEEYESFKKFYDDCLSLYPDSKVVMTHSGVFHADEVMALALCRYLKGFEKINIVRTRKFEIFQYADLLADVGHEFNPEKLRYDHHMSDFKEKFNDSSNIILSSAGLVYKYHGKEAIKNILTSWKKTDLTSDDIIDLLFNKIYERLIKFIDGVDNGIEEAYDSQGDVFYPIYKDGTGYDSRISRLNPNKLKKSDSSSQFRKALKIAEEEFIILLTELVFDYFPNYSIIKKAYYDRFNFDKSGNLMFLEEDIFFKDIIFEIEEEENKSIKNEDVNMEQNSDNKLYFVIVKCKPKDVRIKTIPFLMGSMNLRKGICKKFRGLRGKELEDISGISDVNFVHNTGFIGGCYSLEAALQIAKLSVNEKD